MKKLLRYGSTFILLLSLLACLNACGNKEGSAPESAAQTATEKAEETSYEKETTEETAEEDTDDIYGTESEFDWEGEIKYLREIIFKGNGGSAGKANANMTYDEIQSVFEPLVPMVSLLIELKPEIPDGYVLLGELYLLMERMDDCLAIRTKGYEITGDAQLNPEGYVFDSLAGGEDYSDGWGRPIKYVRDGYQELYTYDGGSRMVRCESIYNSEVGSAVDFLDYEYDGEGRVSKVTSWNQEDPDSRTVYIFQYNDDYTYTIEGTAMYNDEEYEKEFFIISRNEYGEIIESQTYKE